MELILLSTVEKLRILIWNVLNFVEADNLK